MVALLETEGALNEPALRDLEAVMRDSSICGLGQAAPNPVNSPAGAFPRGLPEMTDKVDFTLDGKAVDAAPGETIWHVAKREGTTIPHLCHVDLPGYRAGRQLPRLHGRDRRRARAGRLVHPQAGRRHGGQDRYASAPGSRAQMVFELLASNMRPRR